MTEWNDIVERIAAAARESKEIVVLIDPGAAPPELIAELLGSIDAMNRACGGDGYTITLQDCLVIDGRTVGRFVLTPDKQSRWRFWRARTVTVRVRD